MKTDISHAAPQAPLFFEDFTPGREFVTGSRTVTPRDIDDFARLSGDANPLHLDDDYASGTRFGGRIAHGALGIAIATGLLSQLGLTAGSLVALLGIDWQFKAPLRPGDAIRVRLRVARARAREGRDDGVVVFAAAVVNQRDEVVQQGQVTELIRVAPVARGEA